MRKISRYALINLFVLFLILSVNSGGTGYNLCFAEEVVLYSTPQKVKTNTAMVNIRTGPDLKDRVLCRVTRKGTSVKVLGYKGDWFKVKLGSCVGWVKKTVLHHETLVKKALPVPAIIVQKEPVIKKAPIAKKEPVIKKEPVVKKEPVIEKKPVIKKAPIVKEAPVETFPRMGTITEKKVNIRKSPDLKARVLCRVSGKGTSIKVLDRQDDWLKIKIGSCVGWVGSASVAINGKKPVMVQAMEQTAVARQKPFVPREEAAPTIIAVEEAPAPTEAPIEELKEEAVLYVNDFMFAGNTVIDTETLQKITESFKGKELTLDEMAIVTETITMAYQERGYILARAYVPEQEIKDGILKIYIAEGNIGKLKISGNKYYKDRVIKRYFKKQLRDRVVREDQLERALLLTNDMPSLKSKVILEKGEEPLTVDMALDIEDKFAVKLSIDYNNFGSEYIAKHRGGVNIEFTDPWWGSTFGFRGVGGGVPGGLRGLSSQDINDSLLWKVDWDVPVGSYGTKFSVNYLASDYAVGHNLAELELKGDAEIYGAKITHPILRQKNKNLNLTFGYDHKRAKNYQADQTQSLDELNNYYVALDFDNLDRFLGKNIASISYTRSERQIHDDLPSGRSHPKKNTDIYSMDLARIQKIYGYTNLLLRGSGRLCEQRVVPMEQTAIGGYGTVRGHDTSLFIGDSGYTLSGELMFAPPYIGDKVVFGQRIGQMVQFALFFDHGGVFTSNLEAGETRNNYLSGYGGGIRLYYKDIFSLKFDVAFPTKERLAAEPERFHYLMIAINFL